MKKFYSPVFHYTKRSPGYFETGKCETMNFHLNPAIKWFVFTATFFIVCCANAQLNIQSGTTLYIESGAKMVLQVDLVSFSSVQGMGSILMKGGGLQNINANGNTIPNLEIDNASNVLLTGSLKIGNNLLFTNGK